MAHEQFSAAAGDVVCANGLCPPGGRTRHKPSFRGLCRSRRGSGPSVVSGFGYRVTPRLSLEVDLTRAHHERDIAGGLLEGTATGIFGDVVYYFGAGGTQVFVVGSFGTLNSDVTQTYPIVGGTRTLTRNESSFAWGGGGGVTVFLKPQISLRPQFRLVFSEETGVMGQATGSVAVGYHW